MILSWRAYVGWLDRLSILSDLGQRFESEFRSRLFARETL